MGSHLILTGPSGAGKTSLLLGLPSFTGEYDFTVDRSRTTQRRRPGEGDNEKVFMGQDEFNVARGGFLLTFRTYRDYEYGIAHQPVLGSQEIRARVLMPTQALKFAGLVEAPVVICAVSPHTEDLEAVLRARDPGICPADLMARVRRAEQDQLQADSIADIHFANTDGIDAAVMRLGAHVTGYLAREHAMAS